jgi:PHD/YefM family antitoxin component YafN of YafNO toxin-antitoxin module
LHETNGSLQIGSKIIMATKKVENGSIPHKTSGEIQSAETPTWKHALLDLLSNSVAARKELADGEVVLYDLHGKPIVVVLDYQHFTAMVEKLEDLLDAQRAREGLEALQRGDETTVPWERVKANLLVEGLIDE